mmetsp:Transcript_69177/g.144471  ORF Transcript_69177/g.144471 Transcript_69177/m.144471 type:complete len:247 (+) Transcript_69177:1093-1833(+)
MEVLVALESLQQARVEGRHELLALELAVDGEEGADQDGFGEAGGDACDIGSTVGLDVGGLSAGGGGQREVGGEPAEDDDGQLDLGGATRSVGVVFLADSIGVDQGLLDGDYSLAQVGSGLQDVDAALDVVEILVVEDDLSSRRGLRMDTDIRVHQLAKVLESLQTFTLKEGNTGALSPGARGHSRSGRVGGDSGRAEENCRDGGSATPGPRFAGRGQHGLFRLQESDLVVLDLIGRHGQKCLSESD